MPDDGPGYRLGRIERDIAEIKASVMAVQASVAALQLGLVDRFTSRLEFDQYRRDREQRLQLLDDTVNQRIDDNDKKVNQRIDDNATRIDAWDGRLWLGGAMLFVAMATSIFSVLHTIPAPTH